MVLGPGRETAPHQSAVSVDGPAVLAPDVDLPAPETLAALIGPGGAGPDAATAPPPTGAPTAGRMNPRLLLALQRAAGNRAVGLSLQRLVPPGAVEQGLAATGAGRRGPLSASALEQLRRFAELAEPEGAEPEAVAGEEDSAIEETAPSPDAATGDTVPTPGTEPEPEPGTGTEREPGTGTEPGPAGVAAPIGTAGRAGNGSSASTAPRAALTVPPAVRATSPAPPSAPARLGAPPADAGVGTMPAGAGEESTGHALPATAPPGLAGATAAAGESGPPDGSTAGSVDLLAHEAPAQGPADGDDEPPTTEASWTAGLVADAAPTTPEPEPEPEPELAPPQAPEPAPPPPAARAKGGGGHGATPPPAPPAAPTKAPAGGGGGSKPKLSDATLEKWKSASAGATEAVPEPALDAVEQGPAALAQAAADNDAARRAEQPDYETDAKANQKEPPEEPEREKLLDTTEADAAVKSVEDAGRVKLSDQAFNRVEPPPPYPGLTARDFVPQTLVKGLADLEAQIAAAATPEEKAALDKKADALRQQIAEVEAKATEGTPAVDPPAITDKGAASLSPPPPAMGDMMGDALARIMSQVDSKAKGIVAAAGKIVGPPVPPLQALLTEYEPEAETELRRELEGVAAAAGVTAEQLQGKVETLKTDAQATAEAATTELAQKAEEGKATVEKRGDDQSKQVAGATVAVQAEIDAKKQAAEGEPDTEAIERKKEDYLTKAQGVAAQASAALRAAIEKREGEIDSGMREQQHTYDTAASGLAAAIRRHHGEDPEKGRVEARPTLDWGSTKSAEVARTATAMKKAARAEFTANELRLDDTADTARDTIRDWAASKEGRQRSWWEQLFDMFMDWWNQADADNKAWEEQRNAETRDAMGADMDMLVRLRTAQEGRNQEAIDAELAKLSDEQRKIAQQYLLGGNDAIGTVADMTMAKIKDRRAPELAETVEARLIAEWGWSDLNVLANKKNPAFNASVIGNKIKGAVAGVGTDEPQLFEALGQVKGKLEKAALDKFYLETFGNTVEDDVSSDTSGDEWARAEALMEGDRATADAAALHEAIAGLGTDEKAIKEVLRGKSPEEREALMAAYKEKYGVDLEADLKGDLSGAELDNAMALAAGNTELADAAELEEAMAGAGTDEDAINKTYERIRQQVKAEAEAKGMSTAEMEAEIRRRNAGVKKAYEEKYGKSLDAELKGELSGAELELAKAQEAGDLAKIDAATLKVESQSLLYADDEKIEGVIRDQYARAEGDVKRDIAADQRHLAELLQSGDISMEEFKAGQADIKARRENQDEAIKAQAKANMGGLESTYNTLPNTLPGAFDRMIDRNTSGYNKEEIKALIAQGGKLAPEDELFYATAGSGTDEDMVKNTLKGKSAAEIETIKSAYEAKHGEGSFKANILGDLSGRDQFDVGLMLEMGEPQTPEERIKWLEAKAAYEKEGMLGFFMSETGTDPMALDDQLAAAKEQYAEYEAAVANGASPEELAYLKDKMGLTAEGVEEAVTQHRKYVDSVTDTASMVASAVVGVAVTILTAGTAGPLVAAALGAAYGGLAGIAMKAALKGPAYGWEDMAVDMGMTAVDVALSAATAGLGKYLMNAKGFAQLATKGGPGKFAAEGLSEAIENVASGMPSAMAGAMMDENTWKSGDPFGAILGAGGQGALMSGAMGVGIKGAGDAYGGVKGKLGGAADAAPTPHTGVPDIDAKVGEVKVPAELDVDAAVAKAGSGDLPSGSALDTGPAHQPDGGAPTQKPVPSATGKKPPPLPDADALDLGDQLPAETVMMPHPATDAVGARTMYENSIAADPTKEVAVFRNPETGEYIVVQGEAGSVSVGGGQSPEGPHQAQRWKEILEGPDRGRWDLEAHSHPSQMGPGGELLDVAPSDVFPSGGNGDMGVMFHEAATSGQPRSSRIDYTLGGQREYTMFGVDPAHKEPFWIDTPDGAGGRNKVERFASLEDYHARLEGQFPDVELGSVPGWMQGPDAIRDAAADIGPGVTPAAPGGKSWPPGTQPGTGGRPPPIPLNTFKTPRQLDAPIDRGAPLGSAGDFGSITGTPGNGVFPSTMNGKPVVVKVYSDTPEFRAKIEEEMASLRIAERTGYGPRVLGIVEVKPPPGIGLAMERQPGGFIEFDTPTRPLGPAEEAAAQAEADLWRGHVGDDTVRQLDEYFDRLDAAGAVHAGELSFFVDDLGNFRPVDLQGLEKIDVDPAVAKSQKDWHDRLRARAKADLQKAAADNAAAKAAAAPGPGQKPKVKSTTDADSPIATEGDPLTRPRSEDVGGTLTDEMLEQKYGMPKSNIAKFKDFCRDFKLILEVRPTNPEAARLLDLGHLPKPELLKGKSIRKADPAWGYTDADIGKVGHRPPPDPRADAATWEQLTPAQQAEGLAAFTAELEKFKKIDKELQPYFEAGVIEVRGGVLYGRTLKGDMVAFTGDHDIFDVRWADGTRLTMAEYAFIRNEMRFRNMGAEHGAHMWWAETVPETFDPKAFQGIQQGHMPSPDGTTDPLIRFGQGDPKAVWAEPEAPTGPKNEGGPKQDPFGNFSEVSMVDAGPVKPVPADLDPMPDATMMQPPNPKDGQAAMDMYQQTLADDMSREAGLFYNATTGEYLVVQGTADGVTLDPALRAQMLDDRTDVGTWQQLAPSR